MKKKTILYFAICLILLSLPLITSGFLVRLMTHIFMFIVVSSALNIIAGYAGYAAFGNMMFFGLGAYTTAICMERVGIPFVFSMMLGGFVAVIAAVLFGTLFLRLRGHYFALASLGAAEAVRSIVDNLTELTGGGQGMTISSLDVNPAISNSIFYFAMLLLAVVTVTFVWWLSRSRLGYGLMAIRADEEAASVMGIYTTRSKVIAWSLSALFTGLAGGLYAFWFSYIDPPTVFDVMWVVDMFVIILIGGMGTVIGPVIGAVILEAISEVVWSNFIELHLGILGIIIILSVLFMPKGVVMLARNSKNIGDFLHGIKINREISV